MLVRNPGYRFSFELAGSQWRENRGEWRMPVTITESTSIDYDINGDGPPLVLISGLGFGRWGWFKQVPAFSRHFRTITFDIRGERRLENGVDDLVREVVSLLEHLGVKKAHAFGASLGGYVGQARVGFLQSRGRGQARP